MTAVRGAVVVVVVIHVVVIFIFSHALHPRTRIRRPRTTTCMRGRVMFMPFLRMGGRIEGTFGKSGKIKVRLDEPLIIDPKELVGT